MYYWKMRWLSHFYTSGHFNYKSDKFALWNFQTRRCHSTKLRSYFLIYQEMEVHQSPCFIDIGWKNNSYEGLRGISVSSSIPTVAEAFIFSLFVFISFNFRKAIAFVSYWLGNTSWCGQIRNQHFINAIKNAHTLHLPPFDPPYRSII